MDITNAHRNAISISISISIYSNFMFTSIPSPAAVYFNYGLGLELGPRFSTQFSHLASYKSVLLAISSQESELALNRSSILQHLPSTSNKKLLCEINWFEFGSFAWKIEQYKSNVCGVRIGS